MPVLLDSEEFPHAAPGCRVAGGGSLTVGVSLVVVMGYCLVDGGGGTGGLNGSNGALAS